jgi:hypothetical protein
MKLTLHITCYLLLCGIAIPDHIDAQLKSSFRPVIIEESCSLHPHICDVDQDGINDIVMVADYVDSKGDDRDNMKHLWNEHGMH